jgi:predicted acetyltransferase
MNGAEARCGNGGSVRSKAARRGGPVGAGGGGDIIAVGTENNRGMLHNESQGSAAFAQAQSAPYLSCADPKAAGHGVILEHLSLVSPSVKYEASFLGLMKEFIAEGSRRYEVMYPSASDDFGKFVERLEGAAAGSRLQPGFVAETTYWLRRDGARIVGTSRLRHRLSRALKHEGGHIGYDIRPSERGKGYGTLQLALVLEQAVKMEFVKVLVTCDTDNWASARIIEKNGGLLEDRVISYVTGKRVNRYWIDL